MPQPIQNHSPWPMPLGPLVALGNAAGAAAAQAGLLCDAPQARRAVGFGPHLPALSDGAAAADGGRWASPE
jgi:hypothetical protein